MTGALAGVCVLLAAWLGWTGLGARNSRRSSSEPKRASAGVAMSVWTPMAMGTAPQAHVPRASAMTAE